MTDTNSTTKLIIDAGNVRGRLWRNNIGLATFRRGRHTHKVAYGLGGAGGADLIGMRSAADGIAQFVAIEVKRTPSDKPTPRQDTFLRVVREQGGYAAVANAQTAEAVAKDLLDGTNNMLYDSKPTSF